MIYFTSPGSGFRRAIDVTREINAAPAATFNACTQASSVIPIASVPVHARKAHAAVWMARSAASRHMSGSAYLERATPQYLMESTKDA